MIRLEPMTDTELAAYLERSIPEYAQDHVRAGNWEESRALELSRAEHDELLPKGVRTPDNFLFTIHDDDRGGSRVGEVWYALHRERVRPQVFIFWLGVDEKFRGQGIGTQVLRLVEAEAEKLGADSVALHVFGSNTRAQALYRRLGFQPTHVSMAKSL